MVQMYCSGHSTQVLPRSVDGNVRTLYIGQPGGTGMASECIMQQQAAKHKALQIPELGWLAPTKLQYYMMQKLSRRRGPQRQHTTTHTTCMQGHASTARNKRQSVLYMHGIWPTTKGSTVSSTMAQAAITGEHISTHTHAHRHTQQSFFTFFFDNRLRRRGYTVRTSNYVATITRK
jgi:hypothetical protein